MLTQRRLGKNPADYCLVHILQGIRMEGGTITRFFDVPLSLLARIFEPLRRWTGSDGFLENCQKSFAFGSPKEPFSRLQFSAIAILVAGLVAVADEASAQTAVCSDTPAVGERVECKEDAASSNDIDIQLEGVDIDVTVGNTIYGVHAEHLGSGDIDIDVTNSLDESQQIIPSMFDTSGGYQNYAIFGHHTGSGGIDISVTNARIATTGARGHGVHAFHEGAGGIHIDATSIQTDTTGKDSTGVFAWQRIADSDADVSIVATSNRIVSEGEGAHGIRGISEESGDLMMTTMSNTITIKRI